MDDRVLFDRFHQALDVEPPADAYQRLRGALDQRSARPAQGVAWRPRWPRMGLRLVAVVTAAVIVIAAAAALFSTHRVADRTSPADTSQAIMAYKTMVGTDHDKVQTAGQAEGCSSGSEFAGCEVLRPHHAYPEPIPRRPEPVPHTFKVRHRRLATSTPLDGANRS